MKFRLVEDSWQSRKAKIDKNKLNQLCAYIFGDDEVEPADSYMNFKYKDDYLLAATIIDGFYDANMKVVDRNSTLEEEKLIRKRAKEKGVRCRIELEHHRERFEVLEGLAVRLMIPYELISRQ